MMIINATKPTWFASTEISQRFIWVQREDMEEGKECWGKDTQTLEEKIYEIERQ